MSTSSSSCATGREHSLPHLSVNLPFKLENLKFLDSLFSLAPVHGGNQGFKTLNSENKLVFADGSGCESCG